MNDYPSSSPWGPHGPQVNPHSVTPNPTPAWTEPAPSGGGSWTPAPSGGGGGAPGPGWSGGIAGTGPAWSFTVWIRNLAIAGAVLGALAGTARGALLHMPASAWGPLALRMGIAGGAMGASVPALFRAAGSIIRAMVWLAIAGILWIAAMVALGQNWFAGWPR